jgi:ABC-type uncharacterized transport system auxiliary subunit
MRARTLHGMAARRVTALLVLATILAGCGSHTKELDTHAVEVSVTQGVARAYGGTPIRVTCPTHVPIHVGNSFVCAIGGMGTVKQITVQIKDSAGHVMWGLPPHA